VVLTSSFGAQSAVCLHLVTQQADIPVVLVDTGYLFPETYQFIDELSERLSLNLHIYRAQHSAAWQEARYGKLWEQGLEGIERYNWLQQGRADAAGAQGIGRCGLDFRAAAATGQEPPESRRAVVAQRPLQGASADRLDRPRCFPLSDPARTCPITRCGNRATSPSATCTPPADWLTA
jgi:hypothetical protein